MTKKTKIGYISVKPLEDVTNWSGTINNLYNTLLPEYEIVPVILRKPLVFKVIDVVNEKLNISFYPPFFTWYYRMDFNRKVRKLKDVDYLFGCALSQIFGSGINKNGKKLIYLTDAVFSDMLNYYWFNMSEQRRKKLDKLERNSMRDADHIIYSSEWSANGAINKYGVDKDKISIIRFPSPLDDEYEGSKEVDKEEIHLLFVGVDWKRKGADVAIECVTELNKIDKNHKYILDVVGLQSEKEYDNVVFHGKLYRSNPEQKRKLIDLYKNSKFFILPTKADCSPVVMAESYQYGLPFISTRTGGVADLVIDGETGFLFDVEDRGNLYAQRIAELVNNKEEYKRVSENCRRRYEQYHSRESWRRDFSLIIEKLK